MPAEKFFEIKKAKLERFVLPAMRNEGIDMWIVLTREYVVDPLAKDLSADRAVARTALVFINEGNSLKRIAICASYDVDPIQKSGIYDTVISYKKEGLAPHLKKIVEEKNPRKIALNISEDFPIADGLSASTLSYLKNIQIPVPANPIFSIFGPPVINLHISGAVDITGAWRNEKTEQLIVSRLGSVRNEPDFNQQVQINVGGTIGDKLNITADWNTQRQFEFENQLKIRYKGYEDEIIQSIEAGNVSLQTPSSLIGSSQALFGIKANLQLGPLKLTTIASQKKGESQERVLTGGAQTQSVDVFLYQYSQRHYFIDEKYIKTYEPYYQNSPPLRIAPELQVKDIEVWISQLERPEPGLTRFIVADINLPPTTNKSYYDSLRTIRQSDPGRIEVGLFRKLEQGKDYTINADIGVISLNIDIQDNQAIAVAYRVEGPTQIADDDTVYGDFVNSLTDTAVTLVLKLVRPRSPQPSFKKAWILQLRNIYSLAGARNIKKEGFELKLLYKPSPDQEEREDIDEINDAFSVVPNDCTFPCVWISNYESGFTSKRK